MLNRILMSGLTTLIAAAIIAFAASDGVTPEPAPSGQPGSIVSDGTVYPVQEIDAVKTEKEATAASLPAVGSKETLLKLLKDRGAFYNGADEKGWLTDDILVEAETDGGGSRAPAGGAAAPAPEAPSANATADNGGDYSQTNEQVSGVSEGDIVKTDGQYIYVLSGDTLSIVRADGSDMKLVSSLETADIWGAEFYLIGGDRLALIGRENIHYAAPHDGSIMSAPAPVADVIRPRYRDCTMLIIYDISDRTAPVETRRVTMDGSTVSTRVIDDTVYLVTNQYMWGIPYEKADNEAILPFFRDSAAGDALEPFSYDRIYYIPETVDCNYLLTGAINVYEDAPFEPTAYLGAGNMMYMSRDALYIAVPRWDRQRGKTDLLKFDVSGVDIAYSCAGQVDGQPINQYSMDEYDGFFRVATTDWGVGTYVTVLDADMKTVGRTEPLAPDERMQSMRFMGRTGYVVTFRNTDPLFTVDLADPHHPKVLGELKIPGFSQYLHPVGDGLLLGIGRHTQEIFTRDEKGVEEVVGSRDMGMKVSLFDVSDPFNPREADKIILGEGWADVSANPRALMCDPARGLYGFTVQSWKNGRDACYALVLRVKDGKLSTEAELKITAYRYTERLCFIRDTLYLANDIGVTAYDYKTFERTGYLLF